MPLTANSFVQTAMIGCALLCGFTSQTLANDVFRDWKLLCDDGEKCRISQAVVTAKYQRVVLQVQVFKTPEPTVLFSFPLGVMLNTGWWYQVDRKGEKLRPYEFCDSKRCYAGVKLSDNLLGQYKQGRELKVSFYDAARKKISPVISLKGFTKAYGALR